MSKNQRLDDFLKSHDLSHSLLIGYYGGGNYGDEMLLEILQNLLKQYDAKHISVTYKDPEKFSDYHHDLGHKVVSWKLGKLFRAWSRSKNIVVGGGGLWGLDADFKIFVLSGLLFLSQHAFNKNVYLLNVGFYNSTSRLGRISAWLAGKSADMILARDEESYANFNRVAPSKTWLDRDIVWYVDQLDLEAYAPEVDVLERWLDASKKTILLGVRHFKTDMANSFNPLLERLVSANPDKNFIVSPFEAYEAYPEGHQMLDDWKQRHKRLQVASEPFNPLAFYGFLKKHRQDIALIAPQFHVILSAWQHKIPFMPLVYDNKVANLLNSLGVKRLLPIEDVAQADLQEFADNFYEEKN